MNILAFFDFDAHTIKLNKQEDSIAGTYIDLAFDNLEIESYQLPTIIYNNNDLLWYQGDLKALHRENDKPAVVYLSSRTCMWAYNGKFYLPPFPPSAKLFLKGIEPFQEEAMTVLGKYYLKNFDISSIKNILTNIRNEISTHIDTSIFYINKTLEKLLKKFINYGI